MYQKLRDVFSDLWNMTQKARSPYIMQISSHKWVASTKGFQSQMSRIYKGSFREKCLENKYQIVICKNRMTYICMYKWTKLTYTLQKFVQVSKGTQILFLLQSKSRWEHVYYNVPKDLHLVVCTHHNENPFKGNELTTWSLPAPPTRFSLFWWISKFVYINQAEFEKELHFSKS